MNKLDCLVRAFARALLEITNETPPAPPTPRVSRTAEERDAARRAVEQELEALEDERFADELQATGRVAVRIGS